MPGNSRDVVVRFVGDYKSLGDGANQVTGRLQTVATSLKGIATAGAAVAAGSFLKNAITQASDLQEATSKTGVIFGKASSEIVRYAEGAADAIGQSKTQAMDAASTFATFGKAAGLAGTDLSDFSTELVTLSSDLASFHNADPSEVIEAIGAGLRGEAEPLQRFGVLLNDATLRNAALSQGLIKTTKEALTPQQKVLAAHQVIMEQTTDAQGDFTRTADGLANSQRTLAARFADAQAELGQKFLPVAQKVTHALSDGVLPAVVSAGGVVADVLTPAVEGAWAAGEKLAEVWGSLPQPVQYAAVAMAGWAIAGSRVTAMLAPLRSGTQGFGDDVKTAMGAFEVNRVTGTFMALEERIPILGQMGTAFRDTSSLAIGLGGAMGGLQGRVTQLGGVVKGVGAASMVALRSAASGVMGVLGGPWGLALGAAAAGLAIFTSRSAEAEARQKELSQVGKDVADIMYEQADASIFATRAAVRKKLIDDGLYEQAKRYGISLEDLTRATMGEADAQRMITDRIEEHRAEAQRLDEANDGAISTIYRWVNGVETAEGSLDAFKAGMDRVYGSTEAQKKALEESAAAAREEAAAKFGAAGETSRASDAEGRWRTALAQTGYEYDENKSALENLIAAVKDYNNETATAIDSQEGYEAALDNLTASIAENGATLDIHTEAGRSNRDALQELLTKNRDLYVANIENGMSVEQATKIYNANKTQIEKTAAAAKMNKGEVEKLSGAYGAIPKNVTTSFSTVGYDATWAKLNSLSAGQILGEKGMPITPANVRAVQKDLKMGRYASGGPVIGYGTGTSDSNLALLSHNEHVWTAQEVAAAGGHARVEALRRAVLGRELPGFAAGGAVVWPQKVNVSKFKIPDPFAAAMAAAARGGIGSGVQRWAPLVLQVLRMLGQSAALLPNVLRRMNQESGGNPRAINLWDSNARKGTPSIGLMQTIGPTFNAYAGPFRSRGIYDPLANIYAGLNYAIHRYPSLQYAMDKPGGYRNGGWLKPGQLAYNETSRPEPVLSAEQWDQLLANNKTEKHYHLHANVTNRPVDLKLEFRRMELEAGMV